MRALVGLAGPRASGKTTIASNLESQHGYARASFGDFVRDEAKRRGLRGDTSSLQALGNSLIDELGWETFCRRVVERTKSAELVVVDGVRHIAAVAALGRVVAPARFVLVFVQLDDQLASARLSKRARIGDDSAKEMTAELRDLRAAADLVVDGDSDAAGATIATWNAERF